MTVFLEVVHYKCQTTLTITSAFHLTDVQVSGTEHVERGSPIQLVCNATGRLDAPHNVDWYKDGNKVNSDVDKGIIITKKIDASILISVLVIRSSKMADAGVYLCRSSNRHIATLTVHILNGNLATSFFFLSYGCWLQLYNCIIPDPFLLLWST